MNATETATDGPRPVTGDGDRPDDLSTLARPVEYGGDAQVVCDGLVKIYKVADLEVVALQGLDLVVEEGELVAVVGASGSGKSTLLHILGGLDVPSAGRVRVAGHLLLGMDHATRLAYRRDVIGFVWQQTASNLLPYLTVLQNVELPQQLAGVGRRERRRRAEQLLEVVGLSHRLGHRTTALSGGEQQRVATAVALANEPAVLLADEPTGELDTASSHELFAVLRDVNDQLGVTVVVLTHDPLVADEVSRTVQIRDGRTSTEVVRRTVQDEHGRSSRVVEEFAVLDRAGRLQLPLDHVEALDLRERVRLELADDHVGLWPDDVTDGDDAEGTR